MIAKKPRRARATPIERYIREQVDPVDRRRKYDDEQARAGFTRCTIRCHTDDVVRVKAYAARLLKRRLSE